MQTNSFAQNELIYSTLYKKYHEWPFTCARFSTSNNAFKNYSSFQIFLSYRTDAEYNKSTRSWSKSGSSVHVGNYEIENEGMQFIEEYKGFYGVEDRDKHYYGPESGVGNGNLEYTHGFVLGD